MRRFLAIFRKEFLQIRRDPLSLGLLILVPAFLLMLYGYALSFDVKHLPIAVLDEDRTPESRALLDSLFQNPYFDLKLRLADRAEAEPRLRAGAVRAALVIPRGYAAALARGETVHVQALVDGAEANTATTAIGYLEAHADRMTRQLRAAALARAGLPPAVAAVRLEPRVWFNEELRSARFLVPGLIGMLLMLSAVVATSLSIVREKERETMEQMMVSPLRPEELVLGKTLPYILVCLLTMAMVLLLGYVLFGVEVRGSWLALGVSTVFFLFAALGMGVMISASTRSQQVAFQIAIITSLLPAIILSGFIFPIENMPWPVQGLTYLVVPRYFMDALRAIILKGAGLREVWPDLAGMAALGLLFNVVAARKTRKSV